MNRTLLTVVLVVVVVLAIGALVWTITHQGKTKAQSFESQGGGEAGGPASTGAAPLPTKPGLVDE